MNGDGNLVWEQSQGLCDLGVVDFGDVIHFHKVIARANAAQLRPPTLHGLRADRLGLGPR